MSTLARLADFVAGASARELPPRDRAILRRHAADAVVARIAGGHTHEGRAVAALSPGRGADAIAGLAGLIRLSEIDDIHLTSCTTPSAVAVPVALALAAETVCDPERVESAIWVGTELVVRLGTAIDGARVLYLGLWPTRAGATLGAAAAAARMMGLTTAQSAHALSLAAMTSAGRTGRFQGEPSGRWIVFMSAVANGIRSAEAARAGFCGDPAVLEGQWLERALGVPVDAAALSRDLGLTSVYPELSLKPYCTARQALGAAEAMRGLISDGLEPAAITAIAIRVPAAYSQMVGQGLDPAVRASSYVSAAGQVAAAALAPASLYDVGRTSVLGDERILRLSRLASVTADAGLDALFPRFWPAEVEVTTRAGTMRRRVVEPLGDPGNPLDDDGLLDKASRILGHAGQPEAARRVIAMARSAFASPIATEAFARALVTGRAEA